MRTWLTACYLSARAQSRAARIRFYRVLELNPASPWRAFFYKDSTSNPSIFVNNIKSIILLTTFEKCELYVAVINNLKEISMNFVALERGKEYPLPIRAREGAAANFLADGGNMLQIGMPNLTRSEARSIRNDPMKAGIIVDGPLILWVFQFGTIILDCPFDTRIIPSQARWLPDIENGHPVCDAIAIPHAPFPDGRPRPTR
jgi:hypothetical protein